MVVITLPAFFVHSKGGRGSKRQHARQLARKKEQVERLVNLQNEDDIGASESQLEESERETSAQLLIELDENKFLESRLKAELEQAQEDTHEPKQIGMPDWTKVPSSLDLAKVVEGWKDTSIAENMHAGPMKEDMHLNGQFQLSNSTCSVQILSMAKCFTAANTMGLLKREPYREHRADKPSGCYYCVSKECGLGGVLYYNDYLASTTVPDDDHMVICDTASHDDCPDQLPPWSSFAGGKSVEGYCSKVYQSYHPPVNVVFYLYDESPHSRLEIYYPFIKARILASVPHVRIIFTTDPPLLNNTLVLFASNPEEQSESKVFIETYLIRLKIAGLKFGLIHLEDECTFWGVLGCPYTPIGNMTSIYQLADVVFRSYYSEEYNALGHVHWIPLPPIACRKQYDYAPPTTAEEQEIHLSEAEMMEAEAKRTLPCSFAGTIAHDWAYDGFKLVQERVDFIDAFKNTDGLCPFTETVEDYCGDMQRQILAAIPAGNNPECFRLWESLEMKGIPVLRVCDNPMLCMPIDSIPLLQDAPFIRVKEWRDFPAVVRHYMSDPVLAAKKRHEVAIWYESFQMKLRMMVRDNLLSAGVLPHICPVPEFTPKLPSAVGKYYKLYSEDCGSAIEISSTDECKIAFARHGVEEDENHPLIEGKPCYQDSSGLGRQDDEADKDAIFCV